MRSLISFFFLSLPLSLVAQNQQGNIIVFKGYVFSEDSLPVENAYLINYRTLKIIITDSTGYFNTYLQEGDSLMINHISLVPKVIHANKNRADENKIYIPFRIRMINLVSVNEVRYKMEMKYAEKNINRLYKELEELGLRDPTRMATPDPTIPFRMMPGRMSSVSVNVLDIARLIRENKEANAAKKAEEKKERREKRELRKRSRELIR